MTERQSKRIRRYSIIGLLAVVAMVGSVWMVAQQATDGIRDSERQARQELAVAQVQALRTVCPRSVDRDFELLAVNLDLLSVVDDKPQREAIQSRVLKIGKRLPSSDDPKVVAAHCLELFPLKAAD